MVKSKVIERKVEDIAVKKAEGARAVVTITYANGYIHNIFQLKKNA